MDISAEYLPYEIFAPLDRGDLPQFDLNPIFFQSK
jgi:hypothetical protein